MPEATRIDLPHWIAEPALKAVIEALSGDGTEIRFVGGCVRDSLVGRAIKDIDIATPDSPERVVEKLEAAGLKVVPTGLAHGTVTAVSQGQAFEITTLRIDVETDGRHARVAFTDDWEADAARRDLTMNALSMTPDGRLFDPFGGRRDLADGRVRFVGDAAQRMAEDWLRALRFFRFHAHYGSGPLDPDGLAAARQAGPGVARLSIERVRDELLRLLDAPRPMASLTAWADSGLLAVVLPYGFALAPCETLIGLEMELDREADTLLRLAALLGGDADQLENEGRRLRLPNRLSAELAVMGRLAAALSVDDLVILTRALYHDGPAAVARGLMLAAARRDTGDHNRLAAALARADAWIAKPFPLRGADLLEWGVPRGPAVGELLDALEDWWLTAERQPDRDACLAELGRRVPAR